jgi:tetratricopeptide (TPR) repeat protein
MLSPLRTLTAIASCQEGERGADLIERRQGRFADGLAQAYAGAADKNGDNRIEPVELFEYLLTSLANRPAAGAGDVAPQTPKLFLPDDTPPRLTEAAKSAIRKLASNLAMTKPDLAKTQGDFENAQKLLGKEPEAKLIYGLVLLKLKKDAEALKVFDELKTEQPNHLLPLEAAAWLRFRRERLVDGATDLLQLVGKLAPQDGESPSVNNGVANWVGRMREFAATVAPESRRPPAAILDEIDEAAKRLPDDAQAAYEQGRRHVKKVAGEFDKQADEAPDKQEQLTIQTKRKQLSEYSVFPIDASGRKVIEGMQK